MYILKQINGCSIGGPFLIILADIHMEQSEKAIVRPLNPSLQTIC